MKGRKRPLVGWVWRRLPVLLLLLIAAVQITLAARRDLNPWKGGGFGMFATVDGPSVRRLEVVVSGPGFEQPMDLTPVPAFAMRRARSFPSRRHLEGVVSYLQPYWPVGTRRVRVLVWSLEGDPHLPRLRRVSRGTLSLRVTDGRPEPP